MKTAEPASYPANEVAPTSGATSPSSTQNLDLPLLGMHCSACAVRIEKALGKAEGVAGANVNFATTRATVQFDPLQTDPQKLRAVVQKAGYDAIVADADFTKNDGNDHSNDAAQSLSDAENAAREKEYAAQKGKFFSRSRFDDSRRCRGDGGPSFPGVGAAL